MESSSMLHLNMFLNPTFLLNQKLFSSGTPLQMLFQPVILSLPS